MKKGIVLFLFLITISFLSCKKVETPTTKFTITATLQNNSSVSVSWAAFDLSGFKSISIYRSASPIPNPTLELPVNGNLLVGVVTDLTVTNFRDSSINSLAANGTIYYMAVINLNDRIIASNLQQVGLNAFSVTIPSVSTQSGEFIVNRLPEIDALYIYNELNNSISYVSYSQKKIMATATIPFSSGSNGVFYPVMDNGNPEVFLVSGNSIICYNGTTLVQKYVVNVANGSIYDIKVKNGYLYVYDYYYTGNSYYNIQIYNLANQTLISEKNYSYNVVTNSSSGVTNYIFAPYAPSNAFYFRYYSQIYNSQISSYVYKNVIVSYNLVNGLFTDSTTLNIPSMNPDTLLNNNTNSAYIQVSPDGGYITCDNLGDVYAVNGHATHSIASINNSSPTPVYSDDGAFMVGRTPQFSTSTGPTLNPIDIWSLPGFNLVTSFNSPNSTNATIANDYMDNDTLVSYNIITGLSSTGQFSNTLTVFLNKIN